MSVVDSDCPSDGWLANVTLVSWSHSVCKPVVWYCSVSGVVGVASSVSAGGSGVVSYGTEMVLCEVVCVNVALDPSGETSIGADLDCVCDSDKMSTCETSDLGVDCVWVVSGDCFEASVDTEVITVDVHSGSLESECVAEPLCLVREWSEVLAGMNVADMSVVWCSSV